jgi:hypothetical protein
VAIKSAIVTAKTTRKNNSSEQLAPKVATLSSDPVQPIALSEPVPSADIKHVEQSRFHPPPRMGRPADVDWVVVDSELRL